MELTSDQKIYLPKTIHWKQDQIYYFLDPESPHWVAVDEQGAALMRWIDQGLTLGQLIQRMGEAEGTGAGKSWLDVESFVRSLLRAGFGSLSPLKVTPYQGRAFHTKPSALRELWIHTNNICNLSCSHCLVNSSPQVQDWGLSTEQMERLIDEAASLGVDRFYMTGGEPFLRTDLPVLVKRITEKHQAELIVLTNATLFLGKVADEAKQFDREKVRFQVSLDGSSPEVNDPIRGKKSFEQTTRGIRWLVAEGFQVSLTTVVTGKNLHDLVSMTRLAKALNVTSQHLMWLHKRGRSLKAAHNGFFPKTQDLIQVVRDVRSEAEKLGVVLDNWESAKFRANGTPGVKFDLGMPCWDSLCVYSSAQVYPSAAMANHPPLSLGIWGNGESLKQIWMESPVAKLFRSVSVVNKASVSNDPFRYLTGGGDMEHSYFFSTGNGNGQTGSVLGEDPYYPLLTSLLKDAMGDIAQKKVQGINSKGGYNSPRVIHAMGEESIHCASESVASEDGVEVSTIHSNCVLAFDVEKPRKMVQAYYSKAAEQPQADLCCPTKYDPSLASHIPQEVLDRFYGCGSPVELADLKPGETYLDLGSGAGIDCFIAAKPVGATGKVIGVDMTDEMLKVAHRNQPLVAERLGYDVVEFRKGFLEQIPVDSKSIDIVTSNCVVNLSPTKRRVFSEIWRVLNDHGRIVISDIVSIKAVPPRLKVNPDLWGECIVGALTEEEFISYLEEAGFYGVSILKKTFWKTVQGFDFYSVTVSGFKFEKKEGCQYDGQRAVYLGPMKAIVDEEGHLFPRGVEVEVCTDTAAKLSKAPYQGSFSLLKPSREKVEMTLKASDPVQSDCGPGCC